jgi:hypothetical protein
MPRLLLKWPDRAPRSREVASGRFTETAEGTLLQCLAKARPEILTMIDTLESLAYDVTEEHLDESTSQSARPLAVL